MPVTLHMNTSSRHTIPEPTHSIEIPHHKRYALQRHFSELLKPGPLTSQPAMRSKRSFSSRLRRPHHIVGKLSSATQDLPQPPPYSILDPSDRLVTVHPCPPSLSSYNSAPSQHIRPPHRPHTAWDQLKIPGGTSWAANGCSRCTDTSVASGALSLPPNLQNAQHHEENHEEMIQVKLFIWVLGFIALACLSVNV